MRVLVVSLLAVGACGPAHRDPGTIDAPTGTADAPDAPPSVDMSRVYAHSGGTLYRMDAVTLSVQQIGPMTGLGTQSLTDLAVDKDDHMVGITLDKLYAIDETSGTVTLVKDLSQSAHGFTSLSYVPTDLNDPASPDILVSANDQGDVYQIDPASGTATKIGSYGSTAVGKVVSSGDLIGVRNFGIYATVDVGTEPNDYLAKIDPATWKATPLGTGTGYNNIFGLGFWGGKIYGFVDIKTGAKGGKMIQIDPNTGAAIELSSGSVEWYGAGVSTSAPVIE